MTLDNATLLLLQRQAVGKALAFQQHQQHQQLQLLCRENELRGLVQPQPSLMEQLALISPPCHQVPTPSLPVHILAPLQPQQCRSVYGEPSIPPELLQAILLREQIQRVLEEKFRSQQMELLKPLPPHHNVVRATPEPVVVTGTTASTEVGGCGGSADVDSRSALAPVSPVADPAPEEQSSTVASASVHSPSGFKQDSSDDDSSQSKENRSSSFKKAKANSAKKDAKWLASLDKLKQYKGAHGDCIVPRGYASDPRLASWVAEQRYERQTQPSRTDLESNPVLASVRLTFSHAFLFSCLTASSTNCCRMASRAASHASE